MEMITSDKLEKISKGNYSTLAFKPLRLENLMELLVRFLNISILIILILFLLVVFT